MKFRKPHRKWLRTTGVALAIVLAGCVASSRSVSKEMESSAHYKLGVSYLNDNATQAAYLEFQKAIDLNPNDKLAHYALGHIYYVQKRNQDALKEFQKVLKIDPAYSEAHNYAGTVYETMGDLDSALNSYQSALKNKLYQTPQYVHFNIGGVYMKQKRFSEAIREFQDAVNIDPGYALAYRFLGEAYLKNGDEASALKNYEESSKLFPDDPVTHFKLGELYRKEKLDTKAEGEFRKVVALAPESDLAKEARKYLDRR